MPARAARKTSRTTSARSKTVGRSRSAAKKSTSARRTATSATARGSTASKSTRVASSRATSRTATKKAVARRSTKRTPNAAFMAPVQPDKALSAIVGSRPLPRTQVTKKVWAYIKKNDLQDANKRTMINADAALKAVFGGKRRIDMFQMTKLVSQRLKPIK